MHAELGKGQHCPALPESGLQVCNLARYDFANASSLSLSMPASSCAELGKGSMFSVPEGGKVGVIGSGRGMTEFKGRGRHDFLPDQ